MEELNKKKLVAIQHTGQLGGSGIGLLYVLEMLMDKFQIIVYCPQEPNDLDAIFRLKGFCVKKYLSLKGAIPFYNGGPHPFDPRFIWQVLSIRSTQHQWSKILEQEEPDYVLINSMIFAWMADTIHKKNAKAICHVREIMPNHNSFWAKKITKQLEKCDGVFFISENEKNELKLKYPQTAIIRDSYKQVTSYSQEELSISLKKIFQNNFNVLYVGGFTPIKGICSLLKSIPYTGDDVVYHIAGYIPDLDFNDKHPKVKIFPHFKTWYAIKLFQKIYNNKKWSNKINIVGQKKDLTVFYQNCDVLVFPSTKAHQARPVFEAGFYKKPVIISDFYQTMENVENGFNGITFTPNDHKALAKAINQLRLDQEYARKLGCNNYKNTIEKHKFETVKEELSLFFDNFDNGSFL